MNKISIIILFLPLFCFGQISKQINKDDIYIPGKELGYMDEDHIHFSIKDNKPVSGILTLTHEDEKVELCLYNGVYQWGKVYKDSILVSKRIYEQEYDGFPHNHIGINTYYSNGLLKEKIRYPIHECWNEKGERIECEE